ncbi:MAG: glutamate--tRNA ligase, partial [Methanobrevibacter sp.]|nr:glutamate--tRNA ligase [Methanobrevibacter sp.]
MNDLEQIIYKHALLNAAKHKGSANPGAVMGSIMSNEPELRSRAKEIGPMSGKIVAQVNALSPEEQASEMEKLGIEVQQKKAKVKE